MRKMIRMTPISLDGVLVIIGTSAGCDPEEGAGRFQRGSLKKQGGVRESHRTGLAMQIWPR
jgi:hypothetical protein